jgi:hypothetical protein
MPGKIDEDDRRKDKCGGGGKGSSGAQARFDKQAAFCAAGGKAPWTNSSGKWMKDGKVVDDPAGPF